MDWLSTSASINSLIFSSASNSLYRASSSMSCIFCSLIYYTGYGPRSTSYEADFGNSYCSICRSSTLFSAICSISTICCAGCCIWSASGSLLTLRSATAGSWAIMFWAGLCSLKFYRNPPRFLSSHGIIGRGIQLLCFATTFSEDIDGGGRLSLFWMRCSRSERFGFLRWCGWTWSCSLVLLGRDSSSPSSGSFWGLATAATAPYSPTLASRFGYLGTIWSGAYCFRSSAASTAARRPLLPASTPFYSSNDFFWLLALFSFLSFW